MAAIWGGAIAAGGSLLGGILGGGAASAAAAQQAAVEKIALQNQTTMYNQDFTNTAPFMFAGQTAISQLQNLLGSNGATGQQIALGQNGLTGLTFQPTEAQLQSTPGYQFDLQQGQQAVANSNAAQGLGVSGAALKGAASYAEGLANNTLTTQDQIFQNNLNNVLNPLQAMANLGENAAAGLGSQGQQSSSTQSGTLSQLGASQASGTIGSANALTSGLNGIGNAANSYGILNAISNNQGSSTTFADGSNGNLGGVIGGGGGYSNNFGASS